MEWTVDGVRREALVYIPGSSTTNACPLVFAFHGHGGNMVNAAKTFGYHKIWPEAIVVYMQGLKTPGKLTDPNGEKPGWQSTLGEQQDRDLKFFDTVLTELGKKNVVDKKRIYATGHSNGGSFTYLLWASRGDQLAAVAPSGSVALPSVFRLLKPKPVFHVAGENDPLVKFAWQKQTIEKLKRLNHCDDQTQPGKFVTVYSSKAGFQVATFINLGGHQFPAEAPALIAEFFQQHAGQ